MIRRLIERERDLAYALLCSLGLAALLALAYDALAAPAPAWERWADDSGAVGYDPPATATGPWALPAGAVDSGAALQAAIDATPLGGTLRLAHCRYVSGRTLRNRRELRVVGPGGILDAQCGIWWGYGIVGWVAERPLTLEHLDLVGRPRPADKGGTATTADGLLVHSRVHLLGVGIRGWDGRCLRAEAWVSRGTNANVSTIRDSYFSGCKGGGMSTAGSDANAWLVEGSSFSTNGGCGVWEASDFGSTYVANHSSNNVACSYSIGYNASGTENPNNHSLALGNYEEDSERAQVAVGSIWLGGQGRAAVQGGGAVVKRDGAGLSADHFTGTHYGIERLGSAATGAYVAEVYRQTPTSTPLVVQVSPPNLPGWIGWSWGTTATGTALAISTSSAAGGGGQLAAPNGLGLFRGGAGCFVRVGTPTAALCHHCDMLLTPFPAIGRASQWTCVGGTWFPTGAVAP